MIKDNITYQDAKDWTPSTVMEAGSVLDSVPAHSDALTIVRKRENELFSRATQPENWFALCTFLICVNRHPRTNDSPAIFPNFSKTGEHADNLLRSFLTPPPPSADKILRAKLLARDLGEWGAKWTNLIAAVEKNPPTTRISSLLPSSTRPFSLTPTVPGWSNYCAGLVKLEEDLRRQPAQGDQYGQGEVSRDDFVRQWDAWQTDLELFGQINKCVEAIDFNALERDLGKRKEEEGPVWAKTNSLCRLFDKRLEDRAGELARPALDRYRQRQIPDGDNATKDYNRFLAQLDRQLQKKCDPVTEEIARAREKASAWIEELENFKQELDELARRASTGMPEQVADAILSKLAVCRKKNEELCRNQAAENWNATVQALGNCLVRLITKEPLTTRATRIAQARKLIDSPEASAVLQEDQRRLSILLRAQEEIFVLRVENLGDKELEFNVATNLVTVSPAAHEKVELPANSLTTAICFRVTDRGYIPFTKPFQCRKGGYQSVQVTAKDLHPVQIKVTVSMPPMGDGPPLLAEIRGPANQELPSATTNFPVTCWLTPPCHLEVQFQRSDYLILTSRLDLVCGQDNVTVQGPSPAEWVPGEALQRLRSSEEWDKMGRTNELVREFFCRDPPAFTWNDHQSRYQRLADRWRKDFKTGLAEACQLAETAIAEYRRWYWELKDPALPEKPWRQRVDHEPEIPFALPILRDPFPSALQDCQWQYQRLKTWQDHGPISTGKRQDKSADEMLQSRVNQPSDIPVNRSQEGVGRGPLKPPELMVHAKASTIAVVPSPGRRSELVKQLRDLADTMKKLDPPQSQRCRLESELLSWEITESTVPPETRISELGPELYLWRAHFWGSRNGNKEVMSNLKAYTATRDSFSEYDVRLAIYAAHNVLRNIYPSEKNRKETWSDRLKDARKLREDLTLILAQFPVGQRARIEQWVAPSALNPARDGQDRKYPYLYIRHMLKQLDWGSIAANRTPGPRDLLPTEDYLSAQREIQPELDMLCELWPLDDRGRKPNAAPMDPRRPGCATVVP